MIGPHRCLPALFLVVAALAAPGGVAPDVPDAPDDPDDTAAVERTLDALHDAASKADGPRYFSQFAPDAVFFGTDPNERWSLDEFEAFAKPIFAEGRGWTYVAVARHVFIAEGGAVAWFDETLENARYGTCRGTGVLIESDGVWRITQYNLSIPIPNKIGLEVVEMIRGLDPPDDPESDHRP